MLVQKSELVALIGRHIQSLEKDARMILDELSKPEPNLQTAWEFTHKLKGSSGTIGFKELHAMAVELCHVIRECQDAGKPADERSLALAQGLCDRLETLTPDQSSLV